MRAVASAPGKVILFGEHFVVKGSRSLVTAIPLRVRVIINPTDQEKIIFKSPIAGVHAWINPGDLSYGDERLAPLAKLLEYLRSSLGYSIFPHEVIVESKLPVGAGLGSSASLAAAYALAYTAFHGSPLDRSKLLAVSYEAEKVAHGNPSGIDNTIAVYGGSLIYKRGSPPQRISVSLPVGYKLIVADTGIQRNTRRVVEHVLRVADATWKASKFIYTAADAIIDLALNALKNNDAELLGLLMNLNQGLLNAVGASSKTIEEVLHHMRRGGALGAKLTGAGWGGAVIALVSEENVDNVFNLVKPIVKAVFSVGIGADGVLLEEP